MPWIPSRRQFVVSASKLAAGLGLTAGVGLPAVGSKAMAVEQPGEGSPGQAGAAVLRVAHVTDMHIQPEKRAGEGVKMCLAHMMERKPGLVLTGGDHLMDIFEQPRERAVDLWKLYHSTIADQTGLTPRACIGNHDIWGWHKAKSKTTGDEVLWGKKWSLDGLRLDSRYYAFVQAGWKFIVLDTIHPDPGDGNGYVSGTDDEQFDWLTSMLRDTPATMPVLVVSHAPILNAETLMAARGEGARKIEISGGKMCLDNLRLIDLFKKHPNVKLSLSGHIHNVERLELHGMTFLCNGAVSGAWWDGRPKVPSDKPRLARADEGYAILDLYADGSFKHEYVTYGWKV